VEVGVGVEGGGWLGHARLTTTSKAFVLKEIRASHTQANSECTSPSHSHESSSARKKSRSPLPARRTISSCATINDAFQRSHEPSAQTDFDHIHSSHFIFKEYRTKCAPWRSGPGRGA
jgi:hypothetical protein